MLINGQEYAATAPGDWEGNDLTLHLGTVAGLTEGMNVEIYDEAEGCTYVERHIEAIRGTDVLVCLDKPEKTPDDDRDEMLIDLSYRLTLLELGLME